MRSLVLSTVIAFFLAACSSTGGATTDNSATNAPTFEDVLQALPNFETFDETAYPSEPPVVEVNVEHDVPEDLLAGSVGANTTGLQRGYRIQVVFAREKMVADQAVDEIHGWISKMRAANPEVELFQERLPVYNVYVQPYFRVRIGDFISREKAEEMLTHVIMDYPRAFIMVDQISVR